jgi:hypothetical protein
MDLQEFNKITDRFLELFEEKRSNYEGFKKEKELQKLREKINKIPYEEHEELLSLKNFQKRVNKVIIDFFKERDNISKDNIKRNEKGQKIARWKEKDNPEWNRNLFHSETQLIVGIRNKPVMWSQLTKEEKKIYRDREIEKRKKNGKTGMWDYMDL